MDDHLKELMDELGKAIYESLSDSDRISEAIGEIKKAGFDVFLVHETTIGFNKHDDSHDDAERPVEASPAELPAPDYEQSKKIKWTTQDHRFLRSLKISLDDEPAKP